MSRIFLSICFICITLLSIAQNPLNTQLDFDIQPMPLDEALILLSEQSKIDLSFDQSIIPEETFVEIHVKSTKLSNILNEILLNTEIYYKAIGNQIILLKSPRSQKKKFTISGYIEDEISGERLIFANINIPKLSIETTTNAYGFYSITVPKGKTIIHFDYLGFQTQIKSIQLRKDIDLNIQLESNYTFDPVIIPGKIEPVSIEENALFGIERLKLKNLKSLPTLGGESDIVRMTHFLPGVSTGADGVGGIHIRGGNADQNLMLLDGVPIYNPSHAIGLFSIFNPDVVKNADLTKGGFPARYGGRLSSVLDVRTKDGNKKKLSAEASLGLISGNIFVEGPIIKNKASFLISARRTFLDFILKPITKNQREKDGGGFMSYFFYDTNAKLNIQLSKNDRFYLSFYNGKDNFYDEKSTIESFIDLSQLQEKRQEELDWGNTIASFRWNHLFKNKLFSNTTLTYSRFNFKTISFNGVEEIMEEEKKLDYIFNRYNSVIEDFAAKIDFDYIPNTNHYIKFGASIIKHDFDPAVITLDEKSEAFQSLNIEESFFEKLDTLKLKQIEAYEYNAYVEDEIKIKNWLFINAGLHYSSFNVDSIRYHSLQPRISLKTKLSNRFAIKGTHTWMTQYLHLLTNSGFGLPIDLWVPSTAQVAPQNAVQTVVGFDWTFSKYYTLNVDGYYKSMSNLINYQEGASFLLNGTLTDGNLIDASDWEGKVTSGRGESYGLEVKLKREHPRTRGWIAYDLAYATRIFDNPDPNLSVNMGEKFPFQFNRRHNIKIVLSHKFSERFELTTNWLFGTGNNITIATGQFGFFFSENNLEEPSNPIIFGSKNNYGLPDYHRLDIKLNFYSKRKWGEEIISLGINNVYNRINPLYIRLRNNPITNIKYFEQVYVLPILPMINYKIKF